MKKHADSECPRCGALFECKAGNLPECGCSQIVLSEAALDYLEAHFDACLCPDCLRAIACETES